MSYKFKTYDKVKLVGRPMETAADSVPIGAIGVVLQRGYDSRFNCQEFLVALQGVECWIKYNPQDIVLEAVDN